MSGKTTVEPTQHKSGFVYWRTQHTGSMRVWAIEYTSGYLADHRCVKATFSCALVSSTPNSKTAVSSCFMLTPGVSHQVADNVESH